jgi:regulator of replication initiation timing
MILNENYSYSIKEASEITEIKPRTLTRYAVKLNKKKVDGRYLLEGFELIQYIKSKKINFTNENTILLENEELKKQIDKLKTTVKLLTNENHLLISEIDKLKTQKDLEFEILENETVDLKARNKKLIEEAIKDIPHQEKLKKAIQLITLEALEQGITHKIFTEEEYQDLIGTISEVDFHIKQVEYLKSRVEKQDAILKELVNQTTQRNFLIAKEKGYDKD